MAILEETVWVNVGYNTDKHYEDLGYIIPKQRNKQGKFYAKRGTKINVKVNDLPVNSHILLIKICDYCNCEIPNQQYNLILRNRNEDGKDCCKDCAFKNVRDNYYSNPEPEQSLALLFPQLINEWNLELNKISTENVFAYSCKKYWWICHKDPNHIYDMVINKRTISGQNCPYCSGQRVHITNCLATLYPRIASEWHPTKNGKLTPYDVTFGSGQEVWWHNEECGHEWLMRIDHRTHYGCDCNVCNESKGEKRIQKYLQNRQFIFINQYSFDDLIGIGNRTLRFDFSVFNDNELKLLIEFDGEQHYKPVRFGGISDEEALLNFNNQKKNDEIKNKYCKQNKIPLIRIPHWDFNNIESILDEKLSDLFKEAS